MTLNSIISDNFEEIITQVNQEILDFRILKFWKKTNPELTITELRDSFWTDAKSRAEFSVDLGVEFGKMFEIFLPFFIRDKGFDCSPSFNSGGDMIFNNKAYEIKTGQGDSIQGATHSPKEEKPMNLIQVLWEFNKTSTLTELLETKAFVSSMTDDQIQSINLRAAESSKYLSEQTMIHVPTMSKTRMLSREGGIVTGKSAKPLISRSVLSKMVAEDSSGAMVPIVDSELWKQAGLDTATFSIVKAQDKDIVNLVLGKGKMSSDHATDFAHSLLTVLEEKFRNSSIEKIVEDGYASSLDEAQVLKHLLDRSDIGASADTKLTYVQGLVDRLMESGPAIGALEGPDAQGPKALLEALGSEIGNDQPAIARGAVFQIQNVGEETITVSGALPQAAKDQLDHMGGVVSAQTNADLAGGMMETHMQALAKAETSEPFRKKLINSFNEARVDTGIFGTKIGRDRIDRDSSILKTLEKVKPKLAMGAIAVAAASAGYYLAKRNRTSKMYDETMHQQPYENTGLVQEANSGIQQDNQQMSARRDPLVTAGVVGNLDRNKIGHTGMGPNKYNHLYGG